MGRKTAARCSTSHQKLTGEKKEREREWNDSSGVNQL